MATELLRVGLIGFGGIGSTVFEALARLPGGADARVVGVLDVPEGLEAARRVVGGDVLVSDDLDALLACKPDIVAECAGHAAVTAHAEKILAHGVDLTVISSGALADSALLDRLRAAAKSSGATMLVPSGALAGMDGLRAACCAGVTQVRYRGRKPPLAWKGTPAENAFDLESLAEAVTFFSGNARDAALQYPKNSNVAAIVALAGVGFDETLVELIADPSVTENQHEVDVEAVTGSFRVALSGHTLRQSPKTSALAAYSVVRCLLDQRAAIVA